MPEITHVFYANAAQAVNQGVSGSDSLRATTICIIEDSDGSIHVGAVTTYDTTDDGERQAAAFAVTAPKVPEETAVIEAGSDSPSAPAPDPQPLDTTLAGSAPDTVTAPDDGPATLDGGASNDSVTADAGADTLTGGAGPDTATAPADPAPKAK